MIQHLVKIFRAFLGAQLGSPDSLEGRFPWRCLKLDTQRWRPLVAPVMLKNLSHHHCTLGFSTQGAVIYFLVLSYPSHRPGPYRARCCTDTNQRSVLLPTSSPCRDNTRNRWKETGGGLQRNCKSTLSTMQGSGQTSQGLSFISQRIISFSTTYAFAR